MAGGECLLMPQAHASAAPQATARQPHARGRTFRRFAERKRAAPELIQRSFSHAFEPASRHAGRSAEMYTRTRSSLGETPHELEIEPSAAGKGPPQSLDVLERERSPRGAKRLDEQTPFGTRELAVDHGGNHEQA
jgi:hypothetical protein